MAIPDHFFQHIPRDEEGVEIHVGERVTWERSDALLGPDAPRTGRGVFTLHWWGVTESWDIRDDVHGQITIYPPMGTLAREAT